MTWINNRLNEIAKATNPRQALADWFNSLTKAQREKVFIFAGWLNPKAYCDHRMQLEGDNIFDELCSSLNIS